MALSIPSSEMVTRTLWWRWMPAGCQPGGAGVRASGGRGRRGGTQDDGFWSAFATTSEAERLQTLTMQQNNRIQLLLKIMQESKKADGAVERGRGLADGMGGGGRAPPARQAGGARDHVLQGNVSGVPHPPGRGCWAAVALSGWNAWM